MLRDEEIQWQVLDDFHLCDLGKRSAAILVAMVTCSKQLMFPRVCKSDDSLGLANGTSLLYLLH